jgi:hypothetical protein
MNHEYVSDWMIFNQTADRLTENIDYLISTIVD